jgi:hypothetical protein
LFFLFYHEDLFAVVSKHACPENVYMQHRMIRHERRFPVLSRAALL